MGCKIKETEVNEVPLMPTLSIKNKTLTIAFFDNGKEYNCKELTLEKDPNSDKNFRLNLNLLYEKDDVLRFIEITPDLKNNEVFQNFLNVSECYNSLKVKVKVKLIGNNITERTGTAVTSNEEDDGDKKNKSESLDD